MKSIARATWIWLRLLVAAVCFAAGPTWAQGQVQTELRADKLLKQDSGQWVAAPAKDAKPGDLVVYTATYRNGGKEPVRQLVATLPVPVGMEWQGPVADDKNPPALASSDGVAFAPIPLNRKVRAADGQEHLQAVPLQEYRALRWTFPELAAGAATTVKVTTKVSTNP